MTPFISSRVRKLDVGISGYTDTDSVLNVTGKVSVGTAIDLVPYDTINNGTLRLEGSAGTLFSISNNLTSGSIFSVNDATGVPSLDVNANGTILLAPFGQTEYIGIGKTNPTQKVDIDGSIKLSGNLLFENINVISYSAADVGVDTISFEGSEGQLFSVTNNLSTGSLFSVNNVAGLPYIDVDADGTIIAGINADVGNFGIGTETPTEKLEVVGSIKASDGLILSDTGPYNTVIQYVTPTNNRNISFPDATGTIALVAGTTGNVQYNNAGKLAASSDFNVDLDWNESSTVFTGLKLNVTDTASLSDSNLLDLQVGGSSKFNVTKAGQLKTTSGQGDIETGISAVANDYRVNINRLYVIDYGVTYLANNVSSGYRQWLFQPGTGFALNSNAYFGWSDQNFNVQGGNYDIKLWRDDADTLAQRRDTNAQTFRLYNTWGNSGVDFERTSLTRDSSGLVIDAQKGGTGVDPTNLLDLQVDGTAQLRVNNFGQIYRSTPPSTSGIRLKINTGVADYGISDNEGHVNILYNSIGALSVTSNLVGIGGSRSIGFSTGRSWDTADLVFGRDAANTLAQRNGGTDLAPVSQTYRLYNFSVDSTSDYERTSITDDSTGLVINQEYDGTGALRTNLLDIQDNGTSKVTITGNGNVGIGTSVNTNNSKLVVDGTISETVSGIQYPVVSQFDIGTDPNQIPLNQFLGDMAFADFPFAQVANNSNGAEATVVVNAQTTDLYSHIASYSTDVTYQISNLESGHEIKMYLRNTNASARTITIQASTTNSGYANVNLAPGAGTMGAASVSTVTLAATSGTTMIYVANIGGDIVGGILAWVLKIYILLHILLLDMISQMEKEFHQVLILVEEVLELILMRMV